MNRTKLRECSSLELSMWSTVKTVKAGMKNAMELAHFIHRQRSPGYLIWFEGAQHYFCHNARVYDKMGCNHNVRSNILYAFF